MISRTLTRFAPTDDGVFGRLGPWVTAEEEDQDNRPHVSCIPAASYVCRRTMYHRGGYDTFEVTGVPGRSHILFHVANTEEDIEGCIGLGLGLGVLRVKDEDSGSVRWKLAALSSRAAFEAFMASLDGVEEFVLHVVDHAA